MNYSIEAEQGILSAILLEPDALLHTSDILSPGDFYSSKNRIIYEAMLDLYALGEPCDIITLTERLQQKGLLTEAGGTEHLIYMFTTAITSANVRLHSRIVHEAALVRRIGAWSANIVEESKNGGVENFPTWLGKIESDFTEIAQRAQPKHSPYASDIISRTATNPIKNRDKFIVTPSFCTDMLPFYCPGHLWVIGAYTSFGKSTMLSEIICDSFAYGGRPLLFSTEDIQEEKINRLKANLESLPYKKLLIGDIHGLEDKITRAEKKLCKHNPIIYDNIRNIDDICLLTKKHKLRDNVNIVCIDYIQNLRGHEGLYDTMVDAIIKFNAMIKDMEITGIVISQIDNESARKSSKVIGLKGAGEIAATADIVLWLERPSGQGKEQFLDCFIRKNKPFGELALLELAFTPSWAGIRSRY